jgi:hypothetical protein
MIISVFCAESSEDRLVALRVREEPLGRVEEGACREEDLDGFDEVLEEVEERVEEEGMMLNWRRQYISWYVLVDHERASRGRIAQLGCIVLLKVSCTGDRAGEKSVLRRGRR